MSDYSAVAPPQNFNQSTAFAAALQRARQIAAKINPTGAAASAAGTGASTESGQKRPLEDGTEPESKKVASGTGVLPGGDSAGAGAAGGAGSSSAAAAAAAQAAAVAARVAAAAAAGIQGLGVPGLQIAGGPVTNEDIKVPDKMVGLIIGRGGEQISRLQSESGCKIQMAPDSGGAPERVCTLTGNAQAISRAKELIGAIVTQRSRTEGTGGARLDELGLVGGPVAGNTGGSGGAGGTGGSTVEIMVPGPKVGLIIGKGGETIKQLQEKSGAKMVVIQDGPSQENEKPLRITGDPQKVEHAKALVYELIAEKEMQRRDNESGRGRGGRPGGGFDRMGGNGGGRDFDRNRNWENNGPRGDRGDKAEATFTVPAAKCGVIIGRGGETIKQINQQTGAHCELDRRPQSNPNEKIFVIRGNPDQIEQAKRLIAEKLGMAAGTNGGPPTQFPMGGVPGGPGGPGPQQHFAPQNWGAGPAGFQQPWANPQGPHPDQMFAAQNSQIQVNPQTGQPDYSAQWAEYYRSVGMHREADLIEQQAKANKGMVATPGAVQPAAQGAQPGVPAAAAQGQPGVAAAQNGQPDYSAQWAEYYRSIGKIKEAEVIEAQMKSKQAAAAAAGAAGAGGPASGAAAGGPNPGPGGPQPAAGPNPYTQPQYGYQAAGFYGATPQPPAQPGQPQYPAPAGYPNYPAYHPNAAQSDSQ
ncbi:P-element somatic inhibitor isoform X2 [Lycorma delicatula]|uniref:P-element somatic inhibitor isoform X2 n=1 Tax=Lycorma delicatula TaxID=130591 RepID=UPI003F518E29